MDSDAAPPDTAPPDAAAFGRGLGPGIGLNLLVRDIARAVQFQTQVLAARAVWADDDFAILTAQGSVWMLHHDRTYHANPFGGATLAEPSRGLGVELRLYGRDPDAAQAAAEALDALVLAPACDKPHGLREAYLVDPDGYVWVPSRPLAAAC